jgi:hypothetical protein
LPQRSLLRMSTAKTSCTTRRSSHSCGSTVVRRRASSRRRPAALGESPALGQPPRSPGGGAASMAAHAGVAAHRGVRTRAAGLCTGAGGRAHGCRPLGARDARERPCAGQPAPLPGVLARGVDAVPSLCGPPCRGPAPAGVAFGRQRARQAPPGPAAETQRRGGLVLASCGGGARAHPAASPECLGRSRPRRARGGHPRWPWELGAHPCRDSVGETAPGGAPSVGGGCGDLRRHGLWAVHPRDLGGQPPAIGSHYV